MDCLHIRQNLQIKIILNYEVCPNAPHGPASAHGPGRNPWAGPGFSDILQAGPGAGLKLAGRDQARAGK